MATSSDGLTVPAGWIGVRRAHHLCQMRSAEARALVTWLVLELRRFKRLLNDQTKRVQQLTGTDDPASSQVMGMFQYYRATCEYLSASIQNAHRRTHPVRDVVEADHVAAMLIAEPARGGRPKKGGIDERATPPVA